MDIKKNSNAAEAQGKSLNPTTAEAQCLENEKQPKRLRVDSPEQKSQQQNDYDSDSDDEFSGFGGWPRFLIVEEKIHQQPQAKLNCFVMHHWFKGVSSEIKKIKSLKNGTYLVECPSERSSKLLTGRNGSIFMDRKMSVTPHRGLNRCKGKVSCFHLNCMSIAEIKKHLKSQGVIDAYRVSRRGREAGERIPTSTYFLTFAMPKPPEKIEVGWEFVEVEKYVQAPMRCFKCQKFGHPKSRCKGADTCERCGYAAHDGNCSHKPKCTHCKEEHAPTSRECPIYKKELAIQRLRAEKGISFVDAKKEIEEALKKESYASVTSANSGQRSSSGTIKRPSNDVISELPEAIRAESLALARELCNVPESIRDEALALMRDLRASLKEKIKKAPSQETVQLAPGPASQAPAKKQPKGSRLPTPEGKSRPKNSQSRVKTPVPSSHLEGPEKQAPKPDQPTSRSKAGEPSAPTPQAAEGEQAKEPASPTNPPQEHKEKPSAATPHTAEGGTSDEVEMTETIQKTPAKKGTTEQSSFLGSPGDLSFGAKITYFSSGSAQGCQKEFTFDKQPKSKWKRKSSSQTNRPKQSGVKILNRFDPLSPFQDPEEG